MIQTNGGNYASKEVDGKSYQVMTPESDRLMQALKADQVASFVARTGRGMPPGRRGAREAKFRWP